LLIIAFEGYQAKLPQNWQACAYPGTETILYRNIVTKQIIDEHPLDEYYREKVRIARMERGETANEPLPEIEEDEN
jgi:hypothetical protein